MSDRPVRSLPDMAAASEVLGGASPAAVVQEQDACIGNGFLDIPRWVGTVFFPLVMVSSTGTLVVEDAEAFADHLRVLQAQTLRRGAVGFRTRVISEMLPAPKMAVIGTFRDHLSAEDEVITSSSITWSLLWTAGGWRINQIHFNDTRKDASVVSELCSAMEGGT